MIRRIKNWYAARQEAKQREQLIEQLGDLSRQLAKRHEELQLEREAQAAREADALGFTPDMPLGAYEEFWKAMLKGASAGLGMSVNNLLEFDGSVDDLDEWGALPSGMLLEGLKLDDEKTADVDAAVAQWAAAMVADTYHEAMVAQLAPAPQPYSDFALPAPQYPNYGELSDLVRRSRRRSDV